MCDWPDASPPHHRPKNLWRETGFPLHLLRQDELSTESINVLQRDLDAILSFTGRNYASVDSAAEERLAVSEQFSRSETGEVPVWQFFVIQFGQKGL